MCKIAIDCEAVADGQLDDQESNPGKFFDKLELEPFASGFIKTHWLGNDLFFIQRHWLAKVWVKKNFPGIMTIPPECLPSLDIAIGCCPMRLANIEAKAKVLICKNNAPDNLPEGILLVNNWQEVATIVANCHK